MKSLTVALVLVLAVATARAQPGNTPPNVDPGDEPPPSPSAYLTPVAQQQRPIGSEKSESTAFWLSFGGTLGSYGLIFVGSAIANQNTNPSMSKLAGSAASVGLVGTVLAPTFGHWYGGTVFTRGLGLRLGGIAVGITAIAVALSGCTLFSSHGEEDPDCGQGAVPGALLGIGALGMWVGGTVDDIIQAPKRVARNNEARYALTPLLQPDGASLVLAGSF